MTVDDRATGRCPKCGATIRVGDPWCTLCYADLRPAAAPAEPPPAPSAAAGPSAAEPSYSAAVVTGPDPVAAPAQAAAGPSWPCAACGTNNPIALDVCGGCGLPFLSGLREQEPPLLTLPMVGDVSRLSRGQRLALAVGAVIAAVILTFLIGLAFR